MQGIPNIGLNRAPGKPSGSTDTTSTRIPRVFLWGVIAVCVAPFLLTVMGADFGSHGQKFDMATMAQASSSEQVDVMFHRLPGAFTHALLEWTAFCAAIFTVLLAFTQFRMTGDITTPIIGMALFCAGCMDAFHTLAAARLISAVAPNQDLIPFTWAICRIFNALIMIIGVGLFLTRGFNIRRAGTPFLIGISVVFMTVAYAIISYCANSANLPQTQYPDSLVTRPYDVVPLVLFAFAGLYLYPRFYRKVPSLFAHALIISAIPEVVVELHMAFGSSALFDNHFNIPHFLKIAAYVVPLLGLTLDYVRTYREQRQAREALELTQKQLAEQADELQSANADLSRSNAELEQFAYIASHDLQEPLRTVTSFLQLLERKCADDLSDDGRKYINFAVDGSTRMKALVEGLLEFSRVGRSDDDFTVVNSNRTLSLVLADLESAIAESGALIEYDELPQVFAAERDLHHLLQNLISNAVKYRAEGDLRITVGAEYMDGWVRFSVTDDGIGIEPQYFERIFHIFQRLHGRDEYSGLGIGLAMCKKIVEHNGGKIWVESQPGAGSTFYFTLKAEEQAAPAVLRAVS